jgi:amino acid adenylation domain-containing protein
MPDLSHLSDAKRILLQKYLSGNAASSRESEPHITPRPRGNTAPLSLAQEQVWLHGQMAPPEVPVYNETLTIRRSGPLNVVALERTFAEIIRRHEIWRTTFELSEGQPVQVVHPAEAGFRLPLVDLRDIPELEREREAVRIARGAARAPFDLKEGPLLRAVLVKLSECDHRLFLTFHQLVFDGVTAYQVVLPELTAIYRAFSQNEPSPLPEPGIQYADYAIWQRERPKPEVMARQLDYWKSKLAGDLPVLEWPSGQLRPALQTYRGEIQTAVMSKELLQNLKTLGQQQRVSLFMILVAGLACVLHHYTGQDDIILGAPTAGRPRPELEKMPGYFLSIVPLRIDASGNPTFQELLARVRETVLGALANSHISFTQLVEAVRPAPDPARNSFFQVAISVEPPIPPLDSGWNATQSDIATGASKLDLYIDVDERIEGIVGPITYNPDIFEADMISRLNQHWRTLLEGAVANPGQRLAELPVLTAEERKQILVQWNDTESAYPQACIHELFEQQVERSPDAIALKSEESSLTYRELNQRANQLAWFLRERGVGPEVPVGLCIDRGLEMVIALLGILKAGGAYVPLDPRLPDERLSFILGDVQPRMVLTKQSLRRKLFGKDAVALDAGSGAIAQERKESPEPISTPQHLAYIMYTSGSTGKPKGVPVEHRSVVNLLLSMQRTVGVSGADVVLAVTTLSFDIAGLEIYLPLISGTCLTIAGAEQIVDGHSLRNLIAESGATVVQATPATWRLLTEAGWQGSSNLRILCGGETLPPDLAKALIERGNSVWNVYGPTETTIWSSLYRVTGHEQGSIPIGRPIANTTIYILDSDRNPVPVNVPGEIYIGGDGLARGYLNRLELTAERFVENWLSPEKSPRLYRTGDLGRFRSNGDIEYLGRVDSQVKLRGLRIELGEVESVLASHPQVGEAVVIVSGEGEQQKLTAYVVVNEDGRGAPSAGELRRHLRAKLPEYMVPASFLQVAGMPLLPSGKVNRRALATVQGVSLAEQGTVAPRTEVEKKLAEMWAEVLKVKEVGVDQNFFELGGHSLLVLQVMTRIRREFDVELAVRTMFEEPTIAGLGIEVEKVRATGIKPQIPVLERRPRPAAANVSREALLAQLDTLSADDVETLLKDVLDAKPLH